MAANKKGRKCSGMVIATIVMIACFCLLSVYVYIKLGTIKQKHESKSQPAPPSFFEKWKPIFTWFNKEDITESKHSISNISPTQELLTLIKDDIHWIYSQAVSGICLLIPRITSSLVAGLVILVTIILTYFYSQKRKKKKKETKKGDQKKAREYLSHNYIDVFRSLSYAKLFGLLCSCAFVLSIPWEYVRLYQIEVSKRAALMQAGTPPECMPHQMSIFQSFKFWLMLKVSWQQNPCEKYHKALLVDPMWETSPLMVVSSAITRCLLHPLELLFGGVGKCFRLFFSEIPVQWQPVLLLIMTVIIILVLVMHCGYRLHLPMFLKFEPKTPVMVRQSKNSSNKYDEIDTGKGDNSSIVPEKKRLTYSLEEKQTEKSS